MSGALDRFGRTARRRDVRRLDRSHHQGRGAARAAASAGRRAQPRAHAVGLGRRRRSYIHDEVAADKRNPTIGARGKVYGVDFTGDSLLWVDPVEHTSGNIPIPVLAPGAPSYIPEKIDGAVAVLGRGGDLEEHGPPAQPDDGPAAARLDDARRAVRRRTPRSAAAATATRSARTTRWQQSSRQAAVYDPRTQTDDAGRYVLFDPPSAVRRGQGQHARTSRATRTSSAGSTRASGTRPGTPPRRRAGARSSSTPTATARSAPTRSRTSRPIRRATCASPASPTGSSSNPTDGSIWCANAGVPGPDRPSRARQQPAADLQDGGYEPPLQPTPNGIGGFTPARHRRRSQRRALDRPVGRAAHGVASTAASARTLNGPTATGQHCPEGWTLYPAPGSADEGHRRLPEARTSRTTTGSTSSTRWASGQNVPILTGIGLRFAARAASNGKWVVLRVPYPLGLLLTRARRPHRRSEGRLEGPGRLGRLRDEPGVAHRRRQRRAKRAGEVPAAARIRWRSSGEKATTKAKTRRRLCGSSSLRVFVVAFETQRVSIGTRSF